jgi:uncharacterized membrane protein YraQ (UPF0718 family)
MNSKAISKDRVKEKKARLHHGLHSLSVVVFMYVLLLFLDPGKTRQALKISANILFQIFPSLLLIILIMGSINYFLNPKTISKYVGKHSGIKGWVLAILAGILSHGPIYAWYPLLRDLRGQGMTRGLIAVFLYNRAIKLPLLPIMIYYFGTRFVVILISCIVIASIVQGWIFQILEKSLFNSGRGEEKPV